MPCKLQVDDTGACDFLATTGSKVTICFQSDSGMLKLANANYDKKPLTVVNDSCATFTVLEGRKVLSCVLFTPDPSEPVKVSGNCDDGATVDLGPFPFQSPDDFVVCGS